MERLTILFEKSHFNNEHPTLEWFGEWLVCTKTNEFDVVLFNYGEFLDGAELECPKAPKHHTPAIFRGHPTTQDNYRRLAHDLLRFGYRLITSAFEAYHVDYFVRHFKTVEGDLLEPYVIPSVQAGASFGRSAKGTCMPSIYFARDADGFISNQDTTFMAVGSKSCSESKEIAEHFRQAKGKRFVGDVFFEQYIPIKEICGVPVIWRAFYFDGVCFDVAPLDDNAQYWEESPKPPDEMIAAFSQMPFNPFYACDFALTEAENWKLIRAFDGQMSTAPYGEKMALQDFYAGLAKAVAESPHIPEWIWCITARVRDENYYGKEKKLVHGTRHFAPGTKVYLASPGWDERVEVIGVPRYTSRRIKMVVSVRKLENFACEKVYDPEIVAGFTARPQWPFVHFANAGLGRSLWDNSDESRKFAEANIEWLSSLDPNGSRFS